LAKVSMFEKLVVTDEIEKQCNAGLQLQRAISIPAEGKKLLEKACYRAVGCKALLGGRMY